MNVRYELGRKQISNVKSQNAIAHGHVAKVIAHVVKLSFLLHTFSQTVP
jgi:hypothetical protein